VLFASRRTGDQPVRIASKQLINNWSVRGFPTTKKLPDAAAFEKVKGILV